MDYQAKNKETLGFYFNATISALKLAKREERLEKKTFSKLGSNLTLIKKHPVFIEISEHSSLFAQFLSTALLKESFENS